MPIAKDVLIQVSKKENLHLFVTNAMEQDQPLS